jgi:hypothetical protein
MRTSSKIILSAFVLFAIALMVYNTALKAEYLTGKYKDPYATFEKIDLKDFNEVQLNAANMMDVEFKQGPFAVYRSKQNHDSVQINKVGNRLVIDVNMKESPEMAAEYSSDGRPGKKFINENTFNSLIIVCPHLSLLKTDDAFLVKGQKLNKYEYMDRSGSSSYKMINLQLFKFDSLSLIQKGRSLVDLNGTVIRYLKAEVGRRSSLIISSGNHIENIDVEAKAGAELTLHDLSFKFDPSVNTGGRQTYPHLTYNISDSARVKLDGLTLRLLTNK